MDSDSELEHDRDFLFCVSLAPQNEIHSRNSVSLGSPAPSHLLVTPDQQDAQPVQQGPLDYGYDGEGPRGQLEGGGPPHGQVEYRWGQGAEGNKERTIIRRKTKEDQGDESFCSHVLSGCKNCFRALVFVQGLHVSGPYIRIDVGVPGRRVSVIVTLPTSCLCTKRHSRGPSHPLAGSG